MFSSRRERARALLAEQGLDALVISNRPDVAWLSGFRGSNGTLLVSPADQILVTDFRYRSQAAEQASEWTVIESRAGVSAGDTVATTITAREWRRIGFQGDHLSYSQWDRLRQAIGPEERSLVGLNGAVAKLREVKDATEIAAIRAAAKVADATMHAAFEIARPGLTERQLKAEIERYMVLQGADRPSFETIVASGPNSALPHAPISDRALQAGDLVTFDLGAVVGGYCSDLTRTVAIGSCSDELHAIYDLVYRAQIAALKAVRAGVKGQEVDEVARAIIREAGHGDHFGHGLGHGVGIEIHEGPRLTISAETELAAGNVVTVEPGVYVPELGGVRIEDLVVVTATGCDILSAAAKTAEPMVLPA